MKLISLILIAGLFLIFVVLRNYDKLAVKLFSRLVFFVFILTFVLIVVDPFLLQDISHFVGVRRPVDLVLYGFCLALIGLAGLVVSKIRQIEEKLAQLVRAIALNENRRDSQS